MADWSNLPEELLHLIATRLFSVIELKRFRSICTSWRSGAGNNNLLFPNHRPIIYINRFLSLSRASFFRVTLSSSSSGQGWLIKSNAPINYGTFHLLEPLSRLALPHSCKSLDLLEYTVSEIQETYAVVAKRYGLRRGKFPKLKRVVLVNVKKGLGDHKNRVIIGISCDGEMKKWKGKIWGELKLMDNMETGGDTNLVYDEKFSDIIVHKGQTYVLDIKGRVWWINSSLKLSMYGPPLLDDDENITNVGCRVDKSFVECCGELYIVDRFLEENTGGKRKADEYLYGKAKVSNVRTVGFKVYKFDEELGKLVEVKSLGDKAFVMATDTCFSVLAHEFYGCLQNSIYFTDDEREIKVFKLENSNGIGIATLYEYPKSSFHMFDPSFL